MRKLVSKLFRHAADKVLVQVDNDLRRANLRADEAAYYAELRRVLETATKGE